MGVGATDALPVALDTCSKLVIIDLPRVLTGDCDRFFLDRH